MNKQQGGVIKEVVLTGADKKVVRRLAEGDKTARDAAEVIYLRNIAAHVEGGRKSVEMNFLSESFNASPDLILRSTFRKQVLSQQPA